MKLNKNNKYARSVAFGLTLLAGLSILGTKNDDRQFNVYEKEGVVKLIQGEERVIDGYIRTNNTIAYSDDLDYELRVLDYYNLVRINDNVSYIENFVAEHKPYIEYEYAYYDEYVDHCYNDQNIYINKVDNFDSISVDSFKREVGYTKNKNIITCTGNERMVETKYKVYKIVADGIGNFYLIQNIVDNPLDTKDEYPYFKPSRFTILNYSDISNDKVKTK